MNKNGNNHYLEGINNKIKKLDHKKEEYEVQLMEQNKFLEHSNSAVQELKFKNDILHDQYNSLIRLLEKQGIIFEVNFRGYRPHQWENLAIVKGSNGYEIQTKAGNVLMMLDEDLLSIIQDINKRDFYSLIVLRATDKAALLQLRFA